MNKAFGLTILGGLKFHVTTKMGYQQYAQNR